MRYDALIIGAGQAASPLVADFTGRGWNVALAEGHHLGGSCVNYGCSPTKTLVASARAAHLARRGADFGVQTGPISIDFGKVMARQQAIVQRFRGGLEDSFSKNERLTIFRDYAGFVDEHRIAIGDQIVEADRVVINVGARARTPAIPGLEAVDYLTNESLLALKELPEHLVIIGGGYIGLEFGQAFRRFGSRVTIIEAGSQLMSREDEDIARHTLEILQGEDVTVLLNAQVERVSQQQGRITASVIQAGKPHEIVGSHLLLAVGRVPNSDTLSLDKAGIVVDRHGYIEVDDHLRTNVSHVWAVGDVNGEGAFTHTSYNDATILIDNLNGGTRKVSERIMTYAMYIDPPLGRVGMTEKQVRDTGRPALVGRMPMSHVSRAIERDETQGLMKVLVDAETHKFLGAAILGIGGDEIVHSITDLMAANAPYTVMRDAMHIHPTVTELLPTLLEDLEPLR